MATPKCFVDTFKDGIEASAKCEFIENYRFDYDPSDPFIKCLLNNPRPSLGRVLCLGKFYAQTEKTDQLVYSQYTDDSKGSATCVTVKAACNMMLDFYSSLKVVSEDQKNNNLYLLKMYKQLPSSYNSKKQMIGNFVEICEKAAKNYADANLDGKSLEEYEIQLMKEDGTFDYESLPEESDKMDKVDCPTLWDIFFSIGKAFIETTFDSKTFSSIIESSMFSNFGYMKEIARSMFSNFEYMKEIAKSMPDQERDFIKENLLKSANWINQLAEDLEQQPLQSSESVDELLEHWDETVPKQAFVDDYGESIDHLIYDDLLEESDEMEENEEKVT